MKVKPLAYSMGCSGYEILYKCPNSICGMKFNMANEDWHFCPKCGQALDWGVVVTANEEFRELFLKSMYDEQAKQLVLCTLDQLNMTLPVDERHAMQQTDATKRAITKSNISYYLGNGWTKKELIARGFFKPEDFE